MFNLWSVTVFRLFYEYEARVIFNTSICNRTLSQESSTIKELLNPVLFFFVNPLPLFVYANACVII